ncbi:MAG TPA: hypothetical protein VEA78_06715 [Acidimicrobiales bacterium]|nr:hypothetical protein [Acidimicrobiales bacterium]
MAKVDWPAVRTGALVAIALCLPLAILAEVVAGDDDEGGLLVLLLFVGVLIGFASGGYAAAQRTLTTPYTAGALAALAAFVAIQAAGVITNLARDDEITWSLVVFNGLLAYGSGLLGAAVASRQQRA